MMDKGEKVSEEKSQENVWRESRFHRILGYTVGHHGNLGQ